MWQRQGAPVKLNVFTGNGISDAAPGIWGPALRPPALLGIIHYRDSNILQMNATNRKR